MPWADFLELVAFNSISPITDDRADIISAMQTATMVNMFRGGDSRPVSPADFLPFARDRGESAEIEPQSPEEEAQEVRLLLRGIADRRGLEVIKATP